MLQLGVNARVPPTPQHIRGKGSGSAVAPRLAPSMQRAIPGLSLVPAPCKGPGRRKYGLSIGRMVRVI